MTRALIRNTFREIIGTKARFFSIMAIIALGVGFFTGIKATSPSMYNLAENYYREKSLMDFRLVSTTGFTEDDVKAVSAVEGVQSVMPSYFFDLMTAADEGGDLVRLIAVPEDYLKNPSLNDIVINEGREIEKSGEIITESVAFANAKHQLGGKVRFAPMAGDSKVTDMLNNTEYTIVGKAESPLYISYQRGISQIGNGKIDEYMYVSAEDFKIDRYTELYVKADYSDGVSAFSDEYIEKTDELQEKLEQAASEREEAFQVEVIDKAKSDLADAKEKYNSEKSDADKKLSDAEKQIREGEAEYDEKIADAERQLKDAQEKIADGENELAAGEYAYYTKISAADKQLDEKRAELSDAENKYKSSLAEAQEKIASAQAQIDSGRAQLEAGQAELESKAELFAFLEKAQQAVETVNEAISRLQELGLHEKLTGIIDGTKTIIDDLTKEKKLTPEEAQKLRDALDKAQEIIDGAQTLTDQVQAILEKADEVLSGLNEEYRNAEALLEQMKQKLDDAQAELDKQAAEGQAQLDAAKAQIDSGKAQLSAASAELESQRVSGLAKLQNARYSLQLAKTEYANGVSEFEAEKQSGREKLDDAKAEYNKNKSEADKKFADAKKQIDEAQEKVDSLSPSQWYVFNRDDNPGYSTFSQNADRLDAVASVFPLFFLLVAVLVCVTTMTRLIEEKRTEIATLKALGYSNGSIILKYVIYSMLAAVSGSIVGIAAGVLTLPFIIFNAYKIMYYIGDITLVLNIPAIVLGMLAAVITTTAVSIIVCAKSLHLKPAQAMRPKAPKPGKRILLEYFTPLWKRMGFTAKLTARNLFRYKIRMCMTVLGVAGCTALIVAAFGLLNSFDPLTEVQFGEIYKYDVIVAPKDSGTAEDLEYLEELSDNTGCATGNLLVSQSDVTVGYGGKENSESTYLWTMSDPQNFDNMVSIRTRKDHTPLPLDNNGIMVNEKLASILGFSVGDTITLKTGDKTAEAKVSGIFEQYIYNYLYLTPDYYRQLFGTEPKYNLMITSLTDKSDEIQNKFSSELLADDRVTAVSFMGANIRDFKNMLNSLNMVVVVMIVCAAGLAFVVLYNLTNINIAERVREIATFKVLGFYNKETSRFIYKENLILTVLGILAGLLLGILLTGFIIRTVEVDNIMFGRDIYFTTYLYASGLTLLFSLIVNAVMSFKIKAVDMVTSLKSVE